MAKKRALLVMGRSGQIATELRTHAAATDFSLQCCGRETVDLTHFQDVDALLATTKPALVVNAAAFTAVDAAEKDPENAFAVNCHGVANLAEGCRKLDLPLIHISTDYVFDGNKRGAYRADDPIDPVNVYGASKAAGEKALRERHDRHVILRTSWVYSPFGNNFVKTMLKLGAEWETLSVVSDQFGCPTAAADVAGAVIAISKAILDGKTDGFGTFHYCGAGAASRFEFAEEIFRGAAQRGAVTPAKLIPISTGDYETTAARPLNTELSCLKILDNFDINTLPWREPLEGCVAKILLPTKR